MPRNSHLRPPRPRSVTLASWLLLAVATLAAIDTAAASVALRHLSRSTAAYVAIAGSGDQIMAQLSELHADLVYDTSLAAASGVLLAVLGVAVRWPSRLARGTACGLSGMLAVALIIGYTTSPENVTSGTDLPEPARRAAANLLLSWYPVWQSVVAGLEIVALVILAGMLMSSNAGDYYRRVWADDRHGPWSFLTDARGHGSGGQET